MGEQLLHMDIRFFGHKILCFVKGLVLFDIFIMKRILGLINYKVGHFPP